MWSRRCQGAINCSKTSLRIGSCSPRVVLLPKRSISSKGSDLGQTDTNATAPIVKPAGGDVKTTPWYVSQVSPVKKLVDLPPLPADSPQELEKITSYLANDLGLLDLEIIDARDLDTALGPALLVIGTGKSVKHLSRAASDLLTWIKLEYRVVAGREGLLTANFLRVSRRRAHRRAQKQRFVQAVEDDDVLAKTGSWVAVDTKRKGIYVHLFTSERRESLDLKELLSAPSLDEELDATMNEEYGSPSHSAKAEIPDIIEPSNRRGFHTTVNRSYTSAKSVKLDYEKLRNNLAKFKSNKPPQPGSKNENLPASFESLEPIITSDDWRLRHKYVCEACIASAKFPPSAVVESLALQQSSGITLDHDVILQALQAIAYHRQAEFASQEPSVEACDEWSKVCDEKAASVLDLHDVVFRSTGRSLLADHQALLLLFRTFVAPSASSISASSALNDPTPGAQPGLFQDERSNMLRSVLEEADMLLDPQTFVVLLTVLLNGLKWKKFWQTVDKVSSMAQLEDSVVAAIAAMVVKTGDEKQIWHAINRAIPSMYAERGLTMTPELMKALETGLQVIDPDQKTNKTLREALQAAKSSATDLHA